MSSVSVYTEIYSTAGSKQLRRFRLFSFSGFRICRILATLMLINLNGMKSKAKFLIYVLTLCELLLSVSNIHFCKFQIYVSCNELYNEKKAAVLKKSSADCRKAFIEAD